ncbi:arad-like aldolase/epimerase [Aureobasidium pullulans]|uniref:Arad-like aldolase/epimerase n=1 Tax=Aureobasidium pullulans TaxID=5580 RepID=A0A4S9JQ62_AURPU|nr:arad-like aldolase/epimerase [Aureobasidium pullulans]
MSDSSRKPTADAMHEPGLSEEDARGKMAEVPGPPTFNDKQQEREYQKSRLALAFRIFARLGFDEGVAGHITLRDPVEPHTFWVNPFGVPWPTLRARDLIRVGKGGRVIEGGEVKLLNTAAYMIHHAVHEARPDVNAVAHSHSIYGRAFCALGRSIDMISQDSCAFHNDIAVYKHFKGIVLADDEGLAIAEALGQSKAALLQNHGLLTCGETVEETVFWFMSLEKCCHVQLMAEAAAGSRGETPILIHDEDAAFTKKSVGTPQAGWFSAMPTFDLLEAESGGEIF